MYLYASFTAGQSSVQGWCSGGHCYGSIDMAGAAPAPIQITCNSGNACTGTFYGNIDQIFGNANQIGKSRREWMSFSFAQSSLLTDM